MVLKAENVSKQFFRKRADSNVFYAVDKVSLTLEPGRVTVLSGPSGSGKSTLLNMLAGILSPTEGTVRMDETELYSLKDPRLSAFRNAHIGVIPQGQTALQALNVMENVLAPAMLCGKADEKAKAHAMELLRSTDIEGLAQVMPSELSGGELRRMAIARALLNDPEVILADEPTADLDEENTALVLKLLRNAAEEGRSVLIVTHDPAVIEAADVLYEMRAGALNQKN